MHLIRDFAKLFAVKGTVKFESKQIFNLEDTEIGLGDVENTRKNGVVVT